MPRCFWWRSICKRYVDLTGSDRIGIQCDCAQIKVFREQLADTVRKTLKEDEDAARGYVETMRETLTQNYSNAKVRDAITKDASVSDSERLKRRLERCESARRLQYASHRLTASGQAMEEFMSKLSALEVSEQGTEIIRECLPRLLPGMLMLCQCHIRRKQKG